MIETRAYARAGLLGNPSDGYFGKTISIAVRNFCAMAVLAPSSRLRIETDDSDGNVFSSMRGLAERVDRRGYYGGDRLVKAAIKKFHDYCMREGPAMKGGNFTISYRSTIPRQVGLAGSSAIVIAVLRGLMKFYGVDIPLDVIPTIALEAETEELGIDAGLQDRVIQAYEGCVSMDFDRAIMEEKGRGSYERIDPALLPPLYIAYRADLGKVSGRVLQEIRSGYDRGDRRVVDCLDRIAGLARMGREALLRGDHDRFFDLMNENFDLRSLVMTISDGNREMIERARACGASAKFAGSGGSIVGMVRDAAALARLTDELRKIGAEVITPEVE